MCEAKTYILDNIFIRFGTKLNRQTVSIPMSTNCAPLIADLCLFCYDTDVSFLLFYRLLDCAVLAWCSTVIAVRFVSCYIL